MKLCNVSSALNISRKPFTFIKGSDIVIQLVIYYAINVKYILVMKNVIKQISNYLSGKILLEHYKLQRHPQ